MKTSKDFSALGSATRTKGLSVTRWLLVLVAALAVPLCASATGGLLASSKLRLIVLTDINAYASEADDAESLIRLMLYSNQIDIEALITTPSYVCRTVDEASYQRIMTAVHAYGRVQTNLAVHASGYPTEQHLADRVKHGTPSWNMPNVGAGKSNEGSDFIISVVDNTNDSRRVWVAAWTGLTTLAQALYDVKATRGPAEVEAFASKLGVYDIDAQDNCGAWIMHNFPSIKFLCSDWQFWGISNSRDFNGDIVGDPNCFADTWVYNNIQTHGPLGAAYPGRTFNYETDSPSFFYMIVNGLNDPDEQSWGGWGGRFSELKVLNPPKQDSAPQDNESYRPYYGYRDEPDTYTYNGYCHINSMYAGVARWKRAFQNEMAVRMDWSTNASYSGCNHSPAAVLNGDTTLNVLTIWTNAGQSVTLSAAGSSDPDGNTLTYNWYVYAEPSSYKGTVVVNNSNSVTATILLPSDAANDAIHVILEVTDNGIGAPLTAFRRAIIKTGNGGAAPGARTIVNDNETGDGNNQFEYVGGWNYASMFRCYQDDIHSSGNPGAYFNVRFQGSQIKLYGLITFVQGTAEVQIDRGEPTALSFYGATPEGDVELYCSRVLPVGQHLLTVTVKGDGSVAPDKVIIYSVPGAPTPLTCTATGGMLTLSWPTNYLGWSLQVQTNSCNAGLGTNWCTIPGTELVTATNQPLVTGDKIVLYRLNLPNYVPPPPAKLRFAPSQGLLMLSWPKDYLGWSLQVQTNSLGTGLNTNWYTIPGSELLTATHLPLIPGNPAVFYRLMR
jgi:hypothetical protein